MRGDTTDVVAYLKSKAKLLGVVKARRKRHRDIDAHTQLISSNREGLYIPLLCAKCMGGCLESQKSKVKTQEDLPLLLMKDY